MPEQFRVEVKQWGDKVMQNKFSWRVCWNTNCCLYTSGNSLILKIWDGAQSAFKKFLRWFWYQWKKLTFLVSYLWFDLAFSSNCHKHEWFPRGGNVNPTQRGWKWSFAQSSTSNVVWWLSSQVIELEINGTELKAVWQQAVRPIKATRKMVEQTLRVRAFQSHIVKEKQWPKQTWQGD